MSRSVRWDTAMLECLIKMRSEGHGYTSCADVIGVDPAVVGKKCRELGINRKMNVGSVPGTKRMQVTGEYALRV